MQTMQTYPNDPAELCALAGRYATMTLSAVLAEQAAQELRLAAELAEMRTRWAARIAALQALDPRSAA